MSNQQEVQYILDSAELIFDPTAEAIIKGHEVDFTDDDYPAFASLLAEGVLHFLNNYKGGNGFLNNVKGRHLKGGTITAKQQRAVLNVVRRAWRGEDLSGGHGFAQATTASAPLPPPTTTVIPFKEGDVLEGAVEADAVRNKYGLTSNRCFVCNKYIVGEYSFLINTHKPACKASVTPGWTPNGSKNTRQIVRKQSELEVDLRVLPDKGRYAIQQDNGEVNFYIVEKLKRARKLSGRFNWSKYPSYTYQTVSPGSILVRKQSGDTKEFVGVQDVADDFYIGEHEADIQKITLDPMAALVLYGQLIGSCAYCGRSLTDDQSREDGIGPDCMEQKHLPNLRAIGQRALAAAQQSQGM